MPKVPVIEDNADVQELLKAVLTLRDFAVAEASTGKQGLALAGL